MNYVLVTPARNEEAFIERTLQSMAVQTVPPKKWVIVSDGSTDRTDDLVRKYAEEKSWIELIRLPERKERHFAAKVHAFNAGYERVRGLDYDIIGNVDADISFCEDFFEYLLEQFKQNPKLGCAGTHFVENGFHSFRDSYINRQHVNGQCQLFRRECFEQIGGFVPIKGGGEDWAAVTTARMTGWQTYSFDGRIFHHHRVMGTAESNLLASRYRHGERDYLIGNHPLWEIFRGVFQLSKKPYIFGGACILAGYVSAWVRRKQRPISNELVRFHRGEQLLRIKELFSNRLKLTR